MPKRQRPYGHVPIPTDAAGVPKCVLDAPVFHDGAGSAQLLSGELRCTLTALTPLIVANDQFEIGDVAGVTPLAGGEKVAAPESWKLPDLPPDQGGGPIPIDRTKKVIEPLRDRWGRVLIPGSAIKGMLAASIGALTAAPMARVEERSYSYRPNLDFPAASASLQPRPAIVEGWDPVTRNLTLQILPAAAMQEVVFVQQAVAARFPKPIPRVLTGRVSDAKLSTVSTKRKNAKKLIQEASSFFLLSGYSYFCYFGGNDGTGKLAYAFNRGCIYRDVIVPSALVPAPGAPGYVQLVVTDPLVAHHEETIAHLADHKHGHLRAEHPLSKNLNVSAVAVDIRQGIDHVRQPGTLIYVEVEVDPTGVPKVVTSFGQNYRYRWRYRDTVRTLWTRTGPVQRGILVPHPNERVLSGLGNHRAPTQLSGVRLLTGYAIDKDNPGTTGIGEGDFAQLAGRIAVNMAVEQVCDGAEDKDRFMSYRSDFAIPLKVLGLPRASAETEYLDQSKKGKPGYKGEYVSYGDTLVQPSGELAGRKFYRHQPQAAQQPALYRGSHVKHNVPDYKNIASDQSVIARFVSQPGTRFRFTLRFRDLRCWELGAVLAALRPGLVADATAPLAEPGQANPSHAVKLGHGRPLGLGSVNIDIDHVLLLGDLLQGKAGPAGGEASARTALSDFQKKIAPVGNAAKAAWLDLHRYAKAGEAAYPTGPDGEIYTWYTNKRRAHSKSRRAR